MSHRQTMTEIAVAAATTARAFPQLDQDEIGIVVLSGHDRLLVQSSERGESRAPVAADIVQATRDRLQANAVRMAVASIVDTCAASAARMAGGTHRTISWGESFADAGVTPLAIGAIRSNVRDTFGVSFDNLADDGADESTASIASIAARLCAVPGVFERLEGHAYVAVADAAAERAPVVTAKRIDTGRRVAEMRAKGRLVMADAGGSAADPALFAKTIAGLRTDAVRAHFDETVSIVVGGLTQDSPLCVEPIGALCLVPIDGTYLTLGSTVVMAAMLKTGASAFKQRWASPNNDPAAFAGTDSSQDLHVLVTIDDVDDPACSPVVSLYDDGMRKLGEAHLARRLADVSTTLVKEISDDTATARIGDWDEVDAVEIAPVKGTYARLGDGANDVSVSMLTNATVSYTDGSRSQFHLTFVMKDPADGLLTGRLTA